MKNTIEQKTNQKNLLQLIYLRLIAIFGQVITILIAHYILNISLPLNAMSTVLLLLITVTLFTFYRYKSHKNISDKSLFFELLLDVVALTTQLYLSGGISNPFISLFLLQVIIGAILLRALYAWLIALVTIACYIWLSFNYKELHAFHHHNSDSFFNLHLHGMLVSYILAAFLLLIFITKIIKNLKEGDAKINSLKQQSLQKEQVVRMGLLATGAAHELGTPLSTISVIIGDWKNMNLKQDLKNDISTIESQLDHCKKILSQIVSDSGNKRVESATKLPLKTVFDELIKDWKNSRNATNLIYKFNSKIEKSIILDELLSQAFFNVFDNALEESPNFVSIDVNINQKSAIITIEDQGTGFSDNILQNIGKANLSSKNSSGLGLFLTINSLEKLGGTLTASNLVTDFKNVGAKVVIEIPVKNL